MDARRVRELLQAVRDGATGVEEAAETLAMMPVRSLEFASLDLHRASRTGMAEVVYGAGKSGAQIARLLEELHAAGQVAVATRVDEAKAEELQRRLAQVQIHATARLAVLPAPSPPPRQSGVVGVVCAGTSDLPVAEEAAVVLEAWGHPVERFRDVGVAGLHRLVDRLPALRTCNVLIVVAGMEGALASVVAGLVARPVIAVPTSVGYGVAFGGVAALLAMLNSCAPGVSVVNIDNGFGAACQAALVNRLGNASPPSTGS